MLTKKPLSFYSIEGLSAFAEHPFMYSSYFAQRARMYAGSYSTTPDDLDALEDTVFCMFGNHERVVAGARLIKTEHLTFEQKFGLKPQELLPNLPIKGLNYCEMGGIFACDTKPRDRVFLGSEISELIFKLIMQNNLEYDLVFAAVRMGNVGSMAHAAQNTGYQTVVFPDLRTFAPVTDRLPAIMTHRGDIDLIAATNGRAVPIADYYAALKQEGRGKF